MGSNFSHAPSNLLDWLEAKCNFAGSAQKLFVRVSYKDSAKDAYLIGQHRALTLQQLRDAAPDEFLASLAPEANSGRIEVDLPDDRLATAADALERGQADPFELHRLVGGERWLINFGDPNATKALHIGHLRNLAVGQALAGMAEAAGADVTRQSRVGDFGRNIGEAMAGCLEFAEKQPSAARAEALESVSEKSDHFVGRHYARYASESDRAKTSDHGVPAGNEALSRERHLRDDRAEVLLREWLEHQPEARALHKQIRALAVDGQDMTMARLGIGMDRTLFESDYLGETDALLARGLSDGVFEAMESGAVLFPTGRKEFPYFLLTRSDGFPTQHLRYVATWRAITADCADVRTVGVVGREWENLARCTAAILTHYDDGNGAHPEKTVIHGMVTIDDRLVKSSVGGILLLDDVLDVLLDSAELIALSESNRRCSTDQLAAVVALSLFLSHPAKGTISLTPNAMTDPRFNHGWALAKAWSEAWRPEYDGSPDPDIEDPDYRHLLVRSQLLRRTLLRGLVRLDPVPLMQYLRHMSSWFIEDKRSPRAARAMRTLLTSGFITLGLPCDAGDLSVRPTAREALNSA